MPLSHPLYLVHSYNAIHIGIAYYGYHAPLAYLVHNTGTAALYGRFGKVQRRPNLPRA